VRRGPGLLPRYVQGGGQVQIEDGDSRQGSQVFGRPGPGAIGFH
jgi:hypothetical protein